MATTFKVKRGLETNRSGITPAEGELLYTTDEKKVYVGDGSTAGGILVTGVVGSSLNTAVLTGSVTAVSGRFYALNGSAITLTLPASPSAGDWVSFSEVAGNTDNVIARNSANIMGSATDLTLDIAYASATLIYVDASLGWVFKT